MHWQRPYSSRRLLDGKQITFQAANFVPSAGSTIAAKAVHERAPADGWPEKRAGENAEARREYNE